MQKRVRIEARCGACLPCSVREGGRISHVYGTFPVPSNATRALLSPQWLDLHPAAARTKFRESTRENSSVPPVMLYKLPRQGNFAKHNKTGRSPLFHLGLRAICLPPDPLYELGIRQGFSHVTIRRTPVVCARGHVFVLTATRMQQTWSSGTTPSETKTQPTPANKPFQAEYCVRMQVTCPCSSLRRKHE